MKKRSPGVSSVSSSTSRYRPSSLNEVASPAKVGFRGRPERPLCAMSHDTNTPEHGAPGLMPVAAKYFRRAGPSFEPGGSSWAPTSPSAALIMRWAGVKGVGGGGAGARAGTAAGAAATGDGAAGG